MIPKLTDDAVGRLPVDSGRAALLDELLAQPVADRRRLPGWVAPLAAAAVVAGIAGGTVVWREPVPEPPAAPTQVASAVALPAATDIVLDAPGWTVDGLDGTGLRFRNGDARLEITAYDAASYDDYVADRENLADPPAPGEPIQVLGVAAQLWAYAADDHTAIRRVQDGRWLELRGQGMDEAGYRALLGHLRLTSEAEFEASLPDDYVTEEARLPVALSILGEISEVAGADVPRGASLALGDGESKDAYQFGAEVAGAYACAWLEAFENATTHAQPDQAAEAARVLGTARQWPVLQRMDAAGDYPEVVWDYADQVQVGQVPEGYREGLGC